MISSPMDLETNAEFGLVLIANRESSKGGYRKLTVRASGGVKRNAVFGARFKGLSACTCFYS